MLLIFWRLDEIFNLIFIHFGLRNWLLAILYRYSFPHFFHLITVILHVWVFLWTASFAGWHRGMQNWSHRIFYLCLEAFLLLISHQSTNLKSIFPYRTKNTYSFDKFQEFFISFIPEIFVCLLILFCLSCILSCQWFHPLLLERKSCYLRQQMKYLENDDFSK